MNTLTIIALAAGFVSADVGIGYNYKVPHTSYGVPAYQFGGNSGEYNTGYTGGNDAGYNNNRGQATNLDQQNSGYQTQFQTTNSGLYNGVDYQPGTGYQTGSGGQYYQTGGLINGFGGSGVGVVQPSYQFGGGSAQSQYQTFNQYQTSNQYQSSAVHKYQEYYNQLQQQPPQVFKHFYVHAAPEEPEPPKYRQPVSLPPPQKHYKVIFIKAPTQTVYAPQYIPVPQQNEEKTIVYVLVKKPEEAQAIEIPKIEPKPPAKPEVFFIKYNNKGESQAVINNIVNDYNKVDSVSFSGGSDGSGQYLGTQTGSSGQYTQSGAPAQFIQTTGSSQYTSPSSISGHFTQPVASGQYTQTTGSSFGGQQGVQTQGSEASAVTFGPQTTGGQATAESAAVSGESSGFSSAGVISSGLGNYENPIASSQGLPHETYGPPMFRELI